MFPSFSETSDLIRAGLYIFWQDQETSTEEDQEDHEASEDQEDHEGSEGSEVKETDDHQEGPIARGWNGSMFPVVDL